MTDQKKTRHYPRTVIALVTALLMLTMGLVTGCGGSSGPMNGWICAPGWELSLP